jgi:ring-1,2-phenylacetyl-CoA epoxidase subunit PaaC
VSENPRFEYLLRLADNALVSGQRLGEWVTKAPELEEEMALANFALDYVGQARMLFSYAAEVEGKGRDEDQLAFLRDQIDFRNILLVEQPNGDFGQTIARQFLFLSAYQFLLDALTRSSDQRLAEIAARAVKEVRYQLRHTRQWLIRLGDGTDESQRRMQAGIDGLWRYTGEMFAGDEIDAWAVQEGVGPDPASLHAAWLEYVQAALAEANLTMPADEWMDGGGKRGRHSEHLGYLLAEMQYLQRAYPGAKW